MKDWCEHCIIYQGEYILDNGISPINLKIQDSWNNCPICKKERPKEEKRLESVILLYLDTYKEDTYDPHQLCFMIRQWIKERLPKKRTKITNEFNDIRIGFNECLFEVKKALGVE